MLPLFVPVVQTPPPLDPSVSAGLWPTNAAVTLSWDVAHARSAGDSTTVHFATDGKMFYVRFDAAQQGPVVASQHSGDLITGGSSFGNGIAWTDDSVWVDLWPSGSGGFEYQFEYYTGRYGDGRLDTWFRSSTMRVGGRGTLTVTADNTAQWLHDTPDNIQWFDGVSYAYQVNSASSFAIGLRRVIGDPPVPNGGGDCIGECANVSIAYHLRLRQEEFYLAYGDPNTLVTVPQAIFKVTFYFGGQKGT